MAWTKLNDFYQIYSLQEEIAGFINWILYFVNAFYYYFIAIAIIILAGLVIFALIKRFKLQNNQVNRG